jgi:hypothetical protein
MGSYGPLAATEETTTCGLGAAYQQLSQADQESMAEVTGIEAMLKQAKVGIGKLLSSHYSAMNLSS